MFVFKAAVVGAGTMGGQIAQTVAVAGIPVVLKDVRDELVQAGLDEARNVTQGQVAGLVKKGKLSEEQAAAQVEEVVGRIHGATTYEAFGDVEEDVRQSIARIKSSPFVPNKDSVRGFVYDVETGRLNEVT